MKTRIKIQFKSEATLLEPVRALVRQYLKGMGLSRDRAREMTLAVDEACANAIRHAYNNTSDGEITMLLRWDASAIEVIVSDKGEPMPAMVQKDRNKKRRPSLEQPGGLGLQLIRCVFDDVRITTGAKRGNRVRMKLRLK